MSQTTERNTNSTSPVIISFWVFSFSLLLLAGGFGVWKYVAKHHAAKSAAERARLAATTYRVDPETGRLLDASGQPVNPWPETGVEDFSLVDQTGAKVTKEDLLGKPWAACFVFTRCAGQCLNIMAGMQEVYDELKDDDVRLVTITVDPEYDTPEVLAPYAQGFGADPKRWLFLTGDKKDIYHLIQKSFLLPVEEATGPDRRPGYEVVHSPDIVHVGAQGQVVGRYNGLKESDRKKLVKAMKKEAAQLKAKSGFELTERSGQTVTDKDLLGQPWAVCFVFTRCAGQCLQISNHMATLQRELEDAPVRLVTITVDPNYDTPEVLRNYADNFGADPDRWLFLTGKKDYVYSLLQGYFKQVVYEFTGKDRIKGYEVLHSSDVIHFDAQGRFVKKYNGMDPADMARLRKALLAEAGEIQANPHDRQSSAGPAVAEKPMPGSEGGR